MTSIKEIIIVCWNVKNTPDERNKSIICPIIKKGSKTDCKIYRGIALMTHIEYVYEGIL